MIDCKHITDEVCKILQIETENIQGYKTEKSKSQTSLNGKRDVDDANICFELSKQLSEILQNPEIRFAGISGDASVSIEDMSPNMNFYFRLYDLSNPTLKSETKLVQDDIDSEILSEIVARGKANIIVEEKLDNAKTFKLSAVMRYADDHGHEVELSEWDKVVEAIEGEMIAASKQQGNPTRVYKLLSSGVLFEPNTHQPMRFFMVRLNGFG